MKDKKLSLPVIAAVILSVIAVVMVVATVTVSMKNRAHDDPAPPKTSDRDGETSATAATTEPAETSAPETTTPATTTEAASVTDTEATTEPTEAVTTTTPETTTAPETTTQTTPPTTEATTEATMEATTAATTTAATTTAATTKATTKAASIGVLGYDLSAAQSTDKSLAGGDITKLIINEICAKNKSSLKDRDGEYPDWVEIYNPTDKAINLEGAGLSDSADEPLKWVFPSVNIQPKGYLIVFCSDKDTKSPELHTGFKISAGNEQIVLSTSAGKQIDSVAVAKSGDDETYGRYPDGSSTMRILDATPGVSNSKSSTNREAPLSAPIFSRTSGFYDSSFTLTMTADSGTTIYYTTDGSVPTTSSKKYSSAITIKNRSSDKAVLTYMKGTTVDSNSEQFPGQEFEKATVIRAIAVDSKGKASSISTATYFVGSEIASKYKNVSVISVVTDSNGLYNNNTGIYVAGKVFSEWRKSNPNGALDGSTPANFNQRGKDWEREAHVDFFRAGQLEFNEDCGIRIHGGWSRNSQQKSFKFYMRAEYGESKLKYELFENNRAYDNGKKIKEYKRFMIRNGGNDSFSLLYKDAWTQACIKDFPFATQASDVVVCFLDGEYWGLYTLNEVFDNHYVEENYGVDSDNVIMIKVDALEEGLDTDYDKYWKTAYDFVRKNDMSKAENYKKACEYFDMDSFTEYIAMEVYIGNEDWIWNNWACWRARETSGKPYEDGKWRFMVYDTEYAMDLYSAGKNYKYDIFTELASGGGHLGPMVKSLLKSSDFKARLVLAFEDVMNIAFNPTSAAGLLDRFHNAYSPYMSQHFKRYIFWQSANGVRDNKESWKNWLKNRYNYMPEQINSVMNLGTSKTSTLSLARNASSGGTVYINGIPLQFSGNKWEGHYFSGYKITIQAVPASGYEFSGWSGDYDGDSATIIINPTKAFSLTANFKKK